MAKVIINPEIGEDYHDSFLKRDYNLEIGLLISNKLKDLGIDTYLLEDDTLSDLEKIDKINSLIDNTESNILLTLMLASGNDSGSEIIYALKDEDKLASLISNNIEKIGQNVIKYYQLRDPNNTALDFYSIIRNAANLESLIVSLGYFDNNYDSNFLLNNQEELATSISLAIYDYLKGNNVYIIKPGDSLYQIANKYNTTVKELKDLNNLGNDNLTIGNKLLIPSLNSVSSNNNFLTYIVKSGDSLYQIARDYNTTINALKDINNLKSDILSNGQILKIPNQNNQDDNYITYIVKPGDNLYKIASDYETSINEIKNVNGLINNNLDVGEILKIPIKNNLNYINYQVKSGDSLYQIANKYQISVNEIKKLNNLTNNNLSINQILKIPVKERN